MGATCVLPSVAILTGRSVVRILVASRRCFSVAVLGCVNSKPNLPLNGNLFKKYLAFATLLACGIWEYISSKH